MDKVDVFVQGEGIHKGAHLQVERGVSLRQVLQLLSSQQPAAVTENLLVFEEDGEDILEAGTPLPTTGDHIVRLHVHRCKHVKVQVNFNTRQAEHPFAPGTTIGRIKKWAIDEFKITREDATEYVLQIAGSNVRPDADVHVGSLVTSPACAIIFDLVMNVRVNG